MTACLDTDILIDYLRGLAPARTWLEANASETFVLPGIVAMEVVAGCQNQADLRRAQRFMAAFDIVWPDAHECERAYDLLADHHLAANMSIPDCFIAALALERGLRLYTFNVRHYRVVAGLDVQAPPYR